MSADHEQLADDGEREADDLERAGKHMDGRIDDAKQAVDRAAKDPFIPTPAGEDPDEGEEESDYPAKR